MSFQAALLPDGRRLNLNHGPIVEVDVPSRQAAYAAVIARFDGLLEELVAELPNLRPPAGEAVLQGPVARAMLAAVSPHLPLFVTTMAAVAGADAVLAAMC